MRRITLISLLIAPALTIALAVTAIYVGSEMQPYADSISEIGEEGKQLSLKLEEVSKNFDGTQGGLSAIDQKELFEYSRDVQSASGRLLSGFSASIEVFAHKSRSLGIYFLGIALLNIIMIIAAHKELKP